MVPSAPLDVRPHIRKAFEEGKGVVALETTIVTHGLPRPANLECARGCEAMVREAGGVPATIGLLKGRLVIGLEDAELGMLANSDSAEKTNLSNLSAALAAGKAGSTSVSTTLVAAHLAGIEVAVTGGIGGVHRGYREYLDISSDLTTLQRTPGILVCSGAKSILDVAATREQLETRGVPVIGWKTARFPLFYTAGSDLPVDRAVHSVAEVVDIYLMHRSLGLESTILVVADPPAEDALDRGLMERAIDAAVGEAQEKGVAGRELTPFVLSRVKELTMGESLRANLALIRNNSSIGGAIAAELARRRAAGR